MASSQPESFAMDDHEALENPGGGALPVDEVPPAAVVRRDENSISFRHFLQQQTDVVASRHHTSRSANHGAVDLVDISLGLPDFVQDHLVIEAQSGAEPGQGHGSDGPLDLSVLHQVMPEFNPSHRSQNCVGRRAEDESRNIFDDTGVYPHSSTSSQSQSTTLPDFLSDGPMHCASASNSETSSSNQQFGPSTQENRSDMHQRSQSVDTDSQTQLIERLRRELQEKTRSIAQLQNEVVRQRNEISVLREALSNVEQGGPSSNTGKFSERSCTFPLHSQSSPVSHSIQGINGIPNGTRPSSRVLNIADTSESLIRKLMDQITALKDIAADIEDEKEEK